MQLCRTAVAVAVGVWMAVSASSFGGHLRPEINRLKLADVTETSAGVLLDAYLEVAGTTNTAARKELLGRALAPSDPENVAWAELMEEFGRPTQCEAAVAQFILEKSGKAKKKPRLGELAYELYSHIRIASSRPLPASSVAQPVVGPYLAGLKEQLAPETVARLKERMYQLVAGDVAKNNPVSREANFLLWVYINQTGDTKLLRELWRRGEKVNRIRVLLILQDVYQDDEMVSLGCEFVRELASQSSPDDLHLMKAVTFLERQARHPKVKELLQEMISRKPGNFYPALDRLVMAYGHGVAAAKPARIPTYELEVLQRMTKRAQRLEAVTQSALAECDAPTTATGK